MSATPSPLDREAPRGDASLPVPRRLLIIDDDDDLLELMGVVLAHPQVVIETATDGAAGLEKARRWKPDVVLLDLRLPPMGDVDVVVELRRSALNPRIIITSALPRSEFLGAARKLGAYDVLAKPSDIARARATVLGALGIVAAG